MLRMARLLWILVVLVASSTSAAKKNDSSEGVGSSPVPALLETLQTSKDEGALLDAAEKLAAVSADRVEELHAFLDSDHRHGDQELRAVLAEINAAVPDDQGRFRTPGRETEEQKKRDDELDWLGALAKLPASTVGRNEAVARVAAIRALASSGRPEAGTVILDYAFTERGMVFRDEVGRYLRKMAPASLPALIRASQLKRERPSRARYANYQLERLDRQNPSKAVSSADPDLKIHILEAFADSQFREAIYATLDHTDHINPRVREAARKAWTEYTSGKPPKPAPKRKLQLPGGKLTDEKEPLWLDHRELADIELRRRIEEKTGEAPSPRASLTEMTETLFGFYDSRRREKLDALFKQGAKLAADGKPGEAAELFDKVLAQKPDFDRRAKMASTYFELGKALQERDEWSQASTAFAKAHAVDPEGERAQEALSAHHFSRGKMKGSEGDAELARAAEIDADAGDAGGSGGKSWMLYGGIVWFVAGGLLLALGLHLRRRRHT